MTAEELALKIAGEWDFESDEPSPSLQQTLLPYAKAFLAMREAALNVLDAIRRDGIKWGPITGDLEAALAQADALLNPKGGERG